jgi:TetR/AcrR family transcriptional regulator, regulator of cefoperazone and chloramphenicol sensitivity
MSVKDHETRTRVLTAAARLFAANGFKKVTVREICRAADANVAAVNYHFGDKEGLYREVLGKAIETMQATTEAARQIGEGGSAEQKLRVYIRVFLQRVIGEGQDTWIHQLMAHEIADPTPALDLVIEQVIRPRMAYLSDIVADILMVPPEDEHVFRCVMSVQSQCHAMMKSPVSRRFMPNFNGDAAAIDVLAQHIAEFSLGGIRSLRSAEPAELGQHRP